MKQTAINGTLKIHLVVATRRNSLGHILCEQVTLLERNDVSRDKAERITNEFVALNSFPVGYKSGTLGATWRANERSYFYEEENGLFR